VLSTQPTKVSAINWTAGGTELTKLATVDGQFITLTVHSQNNAREAESRAGLSATGDTCSVRSPHESDRQTDAYLLYRKA